MMPNQPGSQAGAPPAEVGPVIIPSPAYRWYHKLSAALLVTICVGTGLFLLVFPWTDYWEVNYFSRLEPSWHIYWTNSYVRGTVSGIGVLNLYISLVEAFRLRRHLPKRG